MGPSILIRKLVRIKANKVAVNVTVPSAFNGMFIATNLCNIFQNSNLSKPGPNMVQIWAIRGPEFVQNSSKSQIFSQKYHCLLSDFPTLNLFG